jgi:hypothetical protein
MIPTYASFSPGLHPSNTMICLNGAERIKWQGYWTGLAIAERRCIHKETIIF